MEKSPLLEVIGYSVENRVIDFLIEGKGTDYTKKDIAEGCDIARPTLYKILPKLITEGIVKHTRTIGRAILYSLDEENEKVQLLLQLETMLLKKSFEEVEKSKVKAHVRH
mgnify:CR=1 FL=1